MNVVLTPTFFDCNHNPWSSSKPEPRYIPLGLSGGGIQDPWNPSFNTTKESQTPVSWNAKSPPTPAPVKEAQPPTNLSFSHDWDDDVSLLNDDPDEDDIQVLPQTTYNVLAPLFAEIYKDDSEFDDDDDEDDDCHDGIEGGARAA